MKSLPEPTISYEPLYQMLVGQKKSQFLLTAINFGIFNHLTEFTSSDRVAEKIGAHPGNTARFLDILAMIDLVEKRGGRYRNRTEASIFLVEDAPHYIGALLKLYARTGLDSQDNLEMLVKNGPAPTEETSHFGNAEMWAAMTRISAAWVTGNVGHMVAEIVTALPDAKHIKRMLDLGGGHGMFACYIVDASPGMTGVVFDRASVVAVAESFIAEYGLAERIGIEAGDYTTDDLGGGYDLVWASATLNFVKDNLDPLIRKVYDALNPGGYFISFQDGMTDEMTKPDTMLGHGMDMLRVGQSMMFAQGEIADTMIRCGFRTVRSRTIDTPMGAMDMDIARKSTA